MLSKILALAFIASAAAQSLTIVQPAPDHWWVAGAPNTLQWTPCDTSIQGSIPAFNVVVMNQNQQVLAGNLSILGNEMTFECSKTITPSFAVGPGYTLFLTNAINTLQVYTSTQFELKAANSPFPPQITSSSSSASGTGTASSSGTSPSATSGSNAAGTLAINVATLFGAVAGAVGALF